MTKKQLKKSLALYKKFIEKNASVIEKELGGDTAGIIASGKAKLDSIIIPDMGKKNMLALILDINTATVALHKAIQEKGYPVEKSIRIFYKLSDKFFASMPKPFRGLMGFFMTSKLFIRKFQKLGRMSQKREYEGNFVLKVDENPAKRGYIARIEECAVRKFYAANHVEELIQYCSFFDYVQAAAAGLALRHTHNGTCPILSCTMEVEYEGETVIRPELEAIVKDIELKSKF